MSTSHLQQFLEETAAVEDFVPLTDASAVIPLEHIDQRLDQEALANAAPFVALEQAQQQYLALEGFKTLLEQRLAFGGASGDTLKAIHIGLEHFMPLVTVNTPSLESFGGTRSRLEATEASVEAFSDAAKAAYQKAQGLIREIINQLRDMYERLIYNIDALDAKADAMITMVGKISGTSNENRIHVAGLNQVAIDGKVVLDDFTRLTYIVEGVTSMSTRYWFKAIDQLGSYVSKHSGADWDTTAYREYLSANLVFDNFATQGVRLDDKWTRSEPAQGNKALFHQDGTFELQIREVEDSAKTNAQEVPVSTQAQLRARLVRVKGMLSKIRAMDQASSKYKAALDNFYRIYGEVERYAADGDEDASRVVSFVSREAYKLASFPGKEVPDITHYALKVLTAVMAVTERELKTYMAPVPSPKMVPQPA